MPRYMDRFEFCIPGIVPVEIHRTACGIHRIGKLPVSVQRLHQRAFTFCCFLHIPINGMITVGWQLTDPEHLRIVQPSDICFHFGPPYLSLFYYNNCEFSSMQQIFIFSKKQIP